MKFIIATGVLFVASMIVIFASASGSPRGINPIGTEAVYLAGEACVVNMTFDRSEEQIVNDMMDCLLLHREARTQ